MNNKETSEEQYSSYNKIELKSTEVQELMGRVPSSITNGTGDNSSDLSSILFYWTILGLYKVHHCFLRNKISNVNSLT